MEKKPGIDCVFVIPSNSKKSYQKLSETYSAIEPPTWALLLAQSIRSVNFNEADLITCFSNDYGYDYWVEKTIDFYHQEKDVVILISSSGESMNMINAAKFAKQKKLKVITFTGHSKNNKLSLLGDFNFWINSKAYNFIENTHQIWLLTICDLIIGKREYPAKK